MANQNELRDDKRTDLFKVDPRRLTLREGLNPREDYGDIDTLVDSIMRNGIKTPLKVIKSRDKYIVVDGHRRFKAIQIILKKSPDMLQYVPVIKLEPQAEDMLMIEMLASNDGKPFNVLELGEIYRRLISFGWDYKMIAEKIGWSPQYQQNLKTIGGFSPVLKQLIVEKNLSVVFIMKLVREKEGNQTDIINAIRSTDDTGLTKGEFKKKISSKVGSKLNQNSLAEIKALYKVQKENDIKINPEARVIFEFIEKIMSQKIELKELAKQIFAEPLPEKPAKKSTNQLAIDEEEEDENEE
jgi:ParB/RepB/Spo0J family partition protein